MDANLTECDGESTMEDYLRHLLRMAANELIARGAGSNPSPASLISEICEALSSGHSRPPVRQWCGDPEAQPMASELLRYRVASTPESAALSNELYEEAWGTLNKMDIPDPACSDFRDELLTVLRYIFTRLPPPATS